MPKVLGRGRSSLWNTEFDIDHFACALPKARSELHHDKHPRNWTRVRRFLIACTAGSLVVPIEMFASLYVGALPQIEGSLSSSRLLVTMGIGIVNLGIALGSLLGTPINRLFGRRWPLAAAGLSFAAFTAGSAAAPTIEALLCLRFLAAFAGSTVFPTLDLTVADLFKPEDRVMIHTVFTSLLCSAAAFGPVLGILMGERVDWRWIFVLSASWACAVAFATCFLPETDLNAIRRVDAGEKNGKTTWDMMRTHFVSGNTGAWESLITPLTLLILEPVLLVTSLYQAFVYGVYFILLEAIPFIFEHTYGLTRRQIGLVFLAPWAGNLFGTFLYFGALQHGHRRQRRLLQSENDRILSHDPQAYIQTDLKPESRLPGVLVGVVSLSCGLLLFALTSERAVRHYAVPVASGFLVGVGIAMVRTPMEAYHADMYPAHSPSPQIASVFLRYFFAAFCPCFALPMYERMGAQKAGLLLSAVGLSGLPLILLLFFFGSQIRGSSRRAAQDEAYVMRDVDSIFAALDRNGSGRKASHNTVSELPSCGTRRLRNATSTSTFTDKDSK